MGGVDGAENGDGNVDNGHEKHDVRAGGKISSARKEREPGFGVEGKQYPDADRRGVSARGRRMETGDGIPEGKRELEAGGGGVPAGKRHMAAQRAVKG